MLEQVLRHINNWFLVPDGIHSGEFTVQDGRLTLPFLQTGQYFRIVGSVFNDGLHQYPESGMINETFNGAVWALAVPKAFLSTFDEIKAWSEKNTPSGFTSESFGGYSYSKATNSKGVAVGWREVFAGRLNQWRRIGGI
jgi:hypothetical protein